MRIVLVNTPWASVDVPSLALGILKRSVLAAVPDAEVHVVYANLDYVDWITQRTGFTFDDYIYFSQTNYFVGSGDWTFSSALYDDPTWRVAEFRETHGWIGKGRLRQHEILHRLAPAFVSELAAALVRLEPDVIGFTSTFQQNCCALATARLVKQAAPGVVTVFGGANCDGPQGEAMHRNFGFVDLVCRGEGEAAFPQLLLALRDGGAPEGLRTVPGLCWRTADGGNVANPMTGKPLPPDKIVAPDYDEYFERLRRSVAGTWVPPKLVVEGARGCWWGEKHHCTFCGLNGSFMEFRSKAPDRFLAEVLDLVRRYQVLDLFLVDNILDMEYISTVLPRLIEADHDLRMLCEIKSNLRRDQLDMLARAGLQTVQPGIENLNTRVLGIMKKGVSGCHNVRMLRDAESLGLTVTWNYLYGFPGERAEDYDRVTEQLPALHHLQPPQTCVRISIERFSPYFDRPELGFPDLQPDIQYRLTYDLPDAELFDFAYIFDAPARGIDGQTAKALDDTVRQWQQCYERSRLVYHDLGDAVVLINQRRAFDWTTLRLTDPFEIAAFRGLDQPRTARSLADRIAAVTGAPAGIDEATGLLRRWRDLGLVFEENAHFLQLATGGSTENQPTAGRRRGRPALARVPEPVRSG